MPAQVVQAALARPKGFCSADTSDIEQQLMSIDFELLFEVLRAANYLGCVDLLKLTSRAVAHLLGSLRDDPEHLAAVLGLSRSRSSPRTSSSLASVRPWSTMWSALVNEPILEPPDDIDEAQSLTALDEDHRIRDEDALELCLLECDAAVSGAGGMPIEANPLPLPLSLPPSRPPSLSVSPSLSSSPSLAPC